MSDINLDKASELVSAIRTLDDKYHEERAKLRERLRAALGTDEANRQDRKASKPKAKTKPIQSLNVSANVLSLLTNAGPRTTKQVLEFIGADHEVAVRSALKKAKATGKVVRVGELWAVAVPAYKEPEQKKTPEPVKAGGGLSMEEPPSSWVGDSYRKA